MNKLVRKLSTFLFVFVFAFSLLPSVSVFASASEHTVKFRAGDVNTFDTEVLAEYGITDATENYFAIKVKTEATLREGLAAVLSGYGEGVELSDEAVNAFFQRALKENSAYMLDDVADWCEDLDATLSHNEDYVLDYSKLVNPVKYTVYFLDTEDESQIATPWIRYVDAKTASVDVEPIMIALYATTNTKVSVDLTAEGEHEVKFFYAYVGEYVHVPSGEEGEVVYRDIINEVVVNNPVVNGNEQQGANNGGQANGNTTDNNNTNPDDNNGGNEVDPGNNGTTEIEDDDTPQGANTEIDDEDVPLYHGGFDTSNPVTTAIFISSIAGVVALFAVITTVIIRNQKKHSKLLSDGNEEESKDEK